MQAPSDTLAFSYHPDLIFKAIDVYERENRIPSREEVENIEVDWFNDIMMVLDYLNWLRNET